MIGLRRRLRPWLARRVDLWYHPSYRLPLAQAVGAPADPRRADDALTWALDLRMLRGERVRESPEVSWPEAALVHRAEYLAELDRPEVVARILASEPERVPVAAILETWRRATGGTVAAARHVLREGGRAVNLLGGFHHAEPAKGGGFCALNDVAIAVAVLRRDGWRGHVVIVDLDAHPPDGLVACLGDDEQATILSLSVASSWSVPEAAVEVTDARVPPGTSDERYLAAVEELLDELPRADLAFYLAGGDPLAGDRLGGLAVSEAGLRERDRRVLRALGRVPTVMLPAGGYSDGSWRVLAGTIAEAAEVGVAIDPAYDPLRRRTRDVMRRLDPQDLSGDAFLTEAELLDALGVPGKREPRFLGYYTRHGLEHALGQYGFLGTLERLGFSDLRVEIESGSGRDRMRVTAAVRDRREVLVDLAASIQPIDRFRVLFVDWLELRDPRAPFTSSRPRLPGQQAPGLGLAEEIGQLLVRAAERLGLQGVAFVPAHYHVAWMSRGRFVVVDPERRGEFRAMQRALAGVPLIEATERMGRAGLPTEHGEPVRWTPVMMAAPIDPGLGEWLAEGEERARRAEERLVDRLAA